MATVDLYEAQTDLSQPGDAVEPGEEVVIARAGKPVARLIPSEPCRPVRRPGLLKGEGPGADDCDAPLPDEVLAAVKGR